MRTAELTRELESVLISAGTPVEGAVVTSGSAGQVQGLQLAGLLGGKRGLTRAGVIALERVLQRRLDELF